MSDEWIVASPTKDFFISMLTRDIKLERAIIDLVDNSIDGAKKLRGKNNFAGLEVDIQLSKDFFQIRDNCGGFSLKEAKNYAFRFGRPNQAKFVEKSIGRFGVGMKRALFKMGKDFTVESQNKSDHFIIDVNVNEWLKDLETWTFDYKDGKELKTIDPQLTEDGTIIRVTELHDSVSDEFSSSSFLNDLKSELGKALNQSINNGLKIILNNQDIVGKEVSILENNDLKPLFDQFIVNDVEVNIIAGIGEPKPSSAGWYIYCNNRLVLEADKSFTTGWKESKEDEASIIKYHNKHAMFRGVVFFSSKDSDKLPITTTKTGIDSDHPVFRSTRPKILNALKQVTVFLNRINEKEIRTELVANSSIIKIEDIFKNPSSYTSKFQAPSISKRARENNLYTTITYSRMREEVEWAKDYLGVSSNKEVGESTFEYFLNIKK